MVHAGRQIIEDSRFIAKRLGLRIIGHPDDTGMLFTIDFIGIGRVDIVISLKELRIQCQP